MNKSKNELPLETTDLIKSLHSKLRLNHKNWHELKNNPDRRALELLISAIGQISNKGKREDVIPLIEQAIKWVKREVKDPGCPSH